MGRTTSSSSSGLRTDACVDVGEVRAGASMPMPGMPMFGRINVERAEVPGRYRAEGDFSMAGTWRLNVDWDGPGA